MKRICVVTGTRAEYGLLRFLMYRVQEEQSLQLQLIVTGMHLSPEFGLTYKQIEADGYIIDEKVEMLLSSDSSIGICKSMGLAMISFSEVYERLQPDILVVLGDRYEIFAAVSAANISRIPVAHLHGGETTEGAVDETLRHCITKMSYLHFTSTDRYRERVIQLGENPESVFNVGALGVENIKNIVLLSKEELEKEIKFEFGKYTALVTFHPVTLEYQTAQAQFQNLLDALDEFKELKVIFTKANSDTDGRVINQMIDRYVSNNPEKSISFISMGQLRYFSTMKYSDMVIGNSSSGIIEAPSFDKITINIGDRQKGRIQANTVINCEPVDKEIKESIYKVISNEFKVNEQDVINPYENERTSERIIGQLKIFLNQTINIKKKFYDIN